jgi:hypothetical protein
LGYSGLPKILAYLSSDYTPVQANVTQKVLIELGKGAALPAPFESMSHDDSNLAKGRPAPHRGREVDRFGCCGWNSQHFSFSLFGLPCGTSLGKLLCKGQGACPQSMVSLACLSFSHDLGEAIAAPAALAECR